MVTYIVSPTGVRYKITYTWVLDSATNVSVGVRQTVEVA